MLFRSSLFAFAAIVAMPASAQQAQVETRQVGSARLENVPEIPQDIRDAVQRYQNYREARFQDWLPDGSMLITTRFGSTMQVHHVPAPGAARRQLTYYGEPVGGAKAVPGQSRFLLTRDTGGDEWFQLFVRDLDGIGQPLTEPVTRNQSPVFAKDGSLLVWSRATKGSADYAIMAADPADAESRRMVWQGTGAVGPQDISADKLTVLLGKGISNRENQLMLLDMASGKVTPLEFSVKAKARFEDPRFVDGDKAILAITNAGGDFRRLVKIDIGTGKMTQLSDRLNWDVEAYDLSPDGRTLAYTINEDGFSRVLVSSLTTPQAISSPELPRGVVTALEFSPDGGKLAIGLTNATTAGDVWDVDLGTGAVTRWTQSEAGELDPARLVEPELVRFKSFDGLSVPAFVYRPKNAASDAKLPVIIDIHGGPEAQTRPSWNPGAQYFADVLGAIVILPNVRGSDGYGTRYLNLDNGPLREDSVKDIGALIDWAGRQPGMDADRIAVYGQSYGGYMSLASMTFYSDRLVGGVERYGISDFISFMENTEAYRRDNRRAEYGDERDPKMRAVFERIAPLKNVGKITKPMLVMQGANDPRVPQSESDQVVAALRGNGVETWYVLYADEGHGFMKKANNDLRREVETMFLKKLFAQ
ncbi:prolyl oligopeptidase family serine peptidase [Blastomonas sp.]|uniref:S9 family peptidase n=1 Tax=Blastomonas sp. TaxID=1909299 RepID=UPI0026315500|nr:prolyl oligopeptidase family serine peptidase [Blastomonas sp.]MDM7957418.1 prolyl oligopeptidase family serine peptidase [Blastomonas sp.]